MVKFLNSVLGFQRSSREVHAARRRAMAKQVRPRLELLESRQLTTAIALASTLEADTLLIPAVQKVREADYGRTWLPAIQKIREAAQRGN